MHQQEIKEIWDAGWKVLGNSIIRLFSIGAQVIKFLTSPPGNLIIFSLATVYFALISVESYWLAVDKMHEALVPKPFIDDGADPKNLGEAVRSLKFWTSVVLSLFVQSVQAFVLRKIRIEAQQNIASQNESAIRGVAIIATYVIDGRIGLATYPIFGVETARMSVNLVWLILDVVGTEVSLNFFDHAYEKAAPQLK